MRSLLFLSGREAGGNPCQLSEAVMAKCVVSAGNPVTPLRALLGGVVTRVFRGGN